MYKGGFCVLKFNWGISSSAKESLHRQALLHATHTLLCIPLTTWFKVQLNLDTDYEWLADNLPIELRVHIDVLPE